ncbi:hypothetical protein Tco_0937082 [Tanacetum coccineum]|uniref:Reverse transcriptase domain-containing protein n=1 Tax=Tanacetum coccineum TaxID=301880 RepID=A0ABQ5DFW1_9ASTR
MSSPNHSTSDLEDAFSSMNILNYTSVSSDYFSALSGSSSFNSSENSTDNMIPSCAEEDRVTFATGTLTNDALSWWNLFAQPIGIDQANQIAWTELKRLLTDKYCP